MSPVANPVAAHMMCVSPWRGIAGAIVCGYFTYSGFADLRDGNFYWADGWWVVLTWAVWLVFATGLLSETHCWREGIFFGLLVLVLAVGLVFSAWSSARPSFIYRARELSVVLWGLAAFVSLMTIRFGVSSANQ